jgi:hypothetical protein
MVYPNAGLPNELGEYDELPETTAALVREWAEARPGQHPGRLLRIHPGAYRRDCRACRRASCEPVTRLAGLPFHGAPESPIPLERETPAGRAQNPCAPRKRGGLIDSSRPLQIARFVNIGERTNVTGSPRSRS